jgi:tetratricopeptide (TPR) repeat protein
MVKTSRLTNKYTIDATRLERIRAPRCVLARIWIDLMRVALLIVVLTIGCGTASKPNAEEQRANQLFLEGQLREAIRGYEKALKSGRTPQLLSRLGLANLLANEPEKAVKYLTEAKVLAPKEVSTRRALAVALASNGQTEAARKEARDIIQSDPELGVGQVLLAAFVETPAQVKEALNALSAYRNNSGWWSVSNLKAEIELALADLYQRNRNERSAQPVLIRVRELKTINPAGAVELAVIYIRLLQLIPAERLLQKAVSSDPNYLPAWSRLAQVAVELKHFDLAQKALRKVPKAIRDTHEVALAQARVYLAKAKAKEAIALLRNRLKNMSQAERNSDRAMVYRLFLAQGLSNSGDDAEARRILLNIVSNPEVSSAARFALIEIDIRQKRYDEAISALKELISEPASASRASDMLGKLYLKKRDAQAAIRFYTDRVKKNPHDARSMHHLGNAYQIAKKKDTAIAYYKKALEVAPGYEASLRTLMSLAIVDEKPQLAEKYLVEQIKLRPESAALQTVAGQFYMERGKKRKALKAFKTAVKLDRANAAAQIRLGRFYLEIDQPTVALSHFNEALRSEPNHILALHYAAQTELTTGSRERAKKHYLRLLELQPENGAALNNLAYLFAASPTTLDAALVYATRARQIAPQSPHVADTLGWILYLKRSYEQALPLLSRAAKDLPREAGVAYHLGMVQLATEREAQGLASLRRALRLSSTFNDYNTAMLIVSMSRKRPDLMKRYLSETFAASPQQNKIHAIEAEYFISEADFAMAEEALKAVLRLDKDDAASRVQLAQIYIRSNRAILALPLLNRALQQQPENLDILRQVAELEARHGDQQRAIKDHLILLERSPADIDALYQLAKLYARSNKTLAEALKTAERATAIAPQEPRIQDILGWIMYQKKDYEKAVALLSKAARRLPEEAEVQYHLGMTQLALKQESGARLLRKALTLSPRFDGSDQARETLREIEKQNAKASATQAQ